MNYIQADTIVGNLPTIENWIGYYDIMTGCVEYNPPTNHRLHGKVTLYATPNWEEDGYCPIAYCMWDGMEYSSTITFKLNELESKERQIAEYKHWVTTMINNIEVVVL